MSEQACAAPGLGLVQGSVDGLPFASGSFDVLTMGYALRHVAALGAACAEFLRVLRPGGQVLLLEVGRPDGRIARNAARFYLGRVVPLLSRVIGSSRRAGLLMRYYWETIELCGPPRPSSRRSAMPASPKPRAGPSSACCGPTRRGGRRRLIFFVADAAVERVAVAPVEQDGLRGRRIDRMPEHVIVFAGNLNRAAGTTVSTTSLCAPVNRTYQHGPLRVRSVWLPEQHRPGSQVIWRGSRRDRSPSRCSDPIAPLRRRAEAS